MKLLINILAIVLITFVYSCSNQSKKIEDFIGENNIEILEDIPGYGPTIDQHFKIKVHYRGYLEDGTEFDSSYERKQPFSFQIGLEQVIKGWEIGLLGMQEGGKRIIKVPPFLAYGEKGVKNIVPPNSTLIFEMEIMKLEPPGYKEITPQELLFLKKEKLISEQEKYFIMIDIRTLNEINKTGLIKDSIHIVAFDEKGYLKKNFLNKLQSNVKKNNHVVLISNKGDFSSILANGLVENLAMTNIYSLRGGVDRWILEGNEVIK